MNKSINSSNLIQYQIFKNYLYHFQPWIFHLHLIDLAYLLEQLFVDFMYVTFKYISRLLNA